MKLIDQTEKFYIKALIEKKTENKMKMSITFF